MSEFGQTFDRAYLQNLAGLRKRQQINNIMNIYNQGVQNAATDGKTSYLLDLQASPYMQTTNIKGQQPPTTEELIEAFQKKYPGCDVSYKEEWLDTDANTKVLKKGIVIDWS